MTESLRPLVAGNWKMNGSRTMTLDLLGELRASLRDAGAARCDIAVCPPAPYLACAAGELESVSGIGLGAQDCHAAESGAHTGEIAATMLADLGCAYAIVGHSERRRDQGESDATVKAKAEAAIAAGLTAILCIGETREDRDAGRAAEIVGARLVGSLPDAATADNTAIAYEPVWAIGTGRTPTGAEIAGMHAGIRAILNDRLARRRECPDPLWRVGQARKRERHTLGAAGERRPGRRGEPGRRGFLVHMSVMSVAIRAQ